MTLEIDYSNWIDDPKEVRPFTIQKLCNWEMVQLILSFYKGKKGEVIDVTFGAGSFWKKKLPLWNLTSFDQVPLFPNVLKSDWLNLPKDKKYDVLFFDPPYSVYKSEGIKNNQVAKGYSHQKI